MAWMRLGSAVLLLIVVATVAGARPKHRVTAVLDLGMKVPQGVLLGGTIDGKWVGPRHLARWLRGGERYRVYDRLRAKGLATGGKATEGSDPVVEDAYLVRLRPHPKGEEAVVAVTGVTNPRPRPVHTLPADREALREAVRGVLVRKGITSPHVEITSALAADLDGNGVEEVVLTAEHRGFDDMWGDAKAGDYSLVLLYEPVPGRPKSIVVTATYPKGTDEGGLAGDEMRRFGPPLVLDVDGDGVMELVVPYGYYEGLGAEVYTLKDLSPRRVSDVMVGM